MRQRKLRNLVHITPKEGGIVFPTGKLLLIYGRQGSTIKYSERGDSIITLDDIITFCKGEAERYKNASQIIPGSHPEKLTEGWKRNQEIYEVLARMAEHYKNNTGGKV